MFFHLVKQYGNKVALTVGGLFCESNSDSGNMSRMMGSLEVLAASFRLRYNRLLFLSTKPERQMQTSVNNYLATSVNSYLALLT